MEGDGLESAEALDRVAGGHQPRADQRARLEGAARGAFADLDPLAGAQVACGESTAGGHRLLHFVDEPVGEQPLISEPFVVGEQAAAFGEEGFERAAFEEHRVAHERVLGGQVGRARLVPMLGSNLRHVDHVAPPGAVGEIGPGLLVQPCRAVGQGEGLAVAVAHLVLAARSAPTGVVAAEVAAFDGTEVGEQDQRSSSEGAPARRSRDSPRSASPRSPAIRASSNNANGESASTPGRRRRRPQRRPCHRVVRGPCEEPLHAGRAARWTCGWRVFGEQAERGGTVATRADGLDQERLGDGGVLEPAGEVTDQVPVGPQQTVWGGTWIRSDRYG